MGDVDRLLARQDGIVSRAQALQSGLSTRQIDRQRQRGALLSVLPGVYRSAQHEWSTKAWVRAAVAWAGPTGVLSGAAAGWWWMMTTFEPVIVELMVPRDRRLRPPAGLVVVRREVDPLDVTRLHDLPVLDRPMAALRAAVALGPDGAQLLDRQLQTGLRYRDLHAAYCRQVGWHGSAAAHRLMATAGDGAAAQSERLCIALLRQAGIKGWRVNHEVTIGAHQYVPDLCFLREQIAIEVDGWAWHSSPDRFRRDRDRQNRFILAGWLVLRFTWYDLTQRPDQVLRQIKAALAGRSSSVEVQPPQRWSDVHRK